MKQHLNLPAQETETHRLVHDIVVAWLRRETRQELTEVEYDASLVELGIDSLGAASIAAELETATHKCLDPEVLLELETIGELADYLNSLPAQRAPRSTPNPIAGDSVAEKPLADSVKSLEHYEAAAAMPRKPNPAYTMSVERVRAKLGRGS